MYKTFAALAMGGLLLQGCSTVPLSSIPKLARVDFMTTDVARLRVAIALPLALAPRPGGVTMQLKYQVGQEAEKSEKLLLVESRSAVDKQGLPTLLGKPEALYVFQLSSADVQRVNALRANITEAKARREKGSLSLGIEAKEFCRLSTLPDGPALATTSVLTSENDGYVTLSRDFDLRSDPKIAESLDRLELCQ